ncbi:hypothetical protein [Candidatus Villigracilis affinis]|uniref:hypothetical protein n=1 Tax=Candidatus Villigracilis affinis TaxID=3140682 RepID=UPI001DE8742D|nr:hypothetical protein [Anaerolineales bacterium]
MTSNHSLPRQILATLVGGFSLFLTVTITWTLGYQLLYAGRIFPGVSVAGWMSPGFPSMTLRSD